MKKLTIAAVLSVLLAAAPAAAVPITEEIISFETHDGITCEGYISYPSEGTGPYPGVLLISGGGANDADFTLRAGYGIKGTQTIYRELARDFSSQGFTVFRYNKRGVGFDHLGDDLNLFLASDHNDLLEDARNALRALVTHPQTDASSLTVLGNSEGAWLAVRLGVQHSEIDLLILVGSPARKIEKIMKYQSVDRYLGFAHEAADVNGDGFLTLDELDHIDGNHGRGSFHISSLPGLLFELDGNGQVARFHPNIDTNGDGRVDIEGELRPPLRAEVNREVATWKSGERGRYYQSLLEIKPLLKYVHRVHGKILFAQGELDIDTPVTEALVAIEKLDGRDRPWDALLFPKLGHTLSKSRNYFKGDGGLTIHDNPTRNAPRKKVRLLIIRRAREMLELGG